MVVSAKEKRTIRVFKFEHGNGKRRKACLEEGCEGVGETVQRLVGS